jgi:hypothetical protein
MSSTSNKQVRGQIKGKFQDSTRWNRWKLERQSHIRSNGGKNSLQVKRKEISNEGSTLFMVAFQVNKVADFVRAKDQEKVMNSKKRYDLHKDGSKENSRNQYSIRERERKRMMEDQYRASMEMVKSSLKEKYGGRMK